MAQNISFDQVNQWYTKDAHDVQSGSILDHHQTCSYVWK